MKQSTPETEKIDDDELNLLNHLFNGNYNKEVRPVKNKSLPVVVKIDLAYTQLIDLVSTVEFLQRKGTVPCPGIMRGGASDTNL